MSVFHDAMLKLRSSIVNFMTPSASPACPCTNAHRRLMDLHEDIHRAIENYLDENEFRRWLNSAIQNSRGVTFLLQKQKAKWEDFDSWYGEWQDHARGNPVLSWSVTASHVLSCAITPFARDCVDSAIDPDLDCLGPDSPLPTMLVDLATGKVSGVEWVPIESDEALVEVGKERYGDPPLFDWTDPIEHVAQRMELSKQFLESDGYAGPMLVLFGAGRRRMFPLPFSDNEPRAAKIATAVDSVGAWQFDGAVYSSETWMGLPGSRGELLGVPASRLLPSNSEFFDEDPRGRRDEALIVVGISADGRSRVLSQPFGRVVGGYLFGEPTSDDSGAHIPDFLRPILDRWA